MCESWRQARLEDPAVPIILTSICNNQPRITPYKHRCQFTEEKAKQTKQTSITPIFDYNIFNKQDIIADKPLNKSKQFK